MGPSCSDRLWFFVSGRYFSVNAFVPNTFFDDGSPGVDDQFIRSALARVTWQMTPRNKFSAYFDEIDKYRGHDMQSNYDPETAAIRWLSPAYHTAAAKWTSTVSTRLLLEGGWSSNLEYYTNSFQSGVEQPRGSSGWFTNTAQIELDLGGHRKTASTSQSSQSPSRYAVNAALSYVDGLTQHQGRVPANLGKHRSYSRHQRRSVSSVPEQQHRSSVFRAEHRGGPQHAHPQRRGTQRRPGHVRAGLVGD